MKKTLYLLLALLIYPAPLLAQTDLKENPAPQILTVTGHGEVYARPDRAVVRLGTITQAKEASTAQQQAGKTIALAVEEFLKMGIPREDISTATLRLSPVFSRQNQKTSESFEPVIVAYRADNSIQVVIDDIGKVGEIIDAGVNAGVNQLEGLSFELKESGKNKDQALRLAVQEARRKAHVMAEALGVEIGGVQRISEGGVNVIRPQMHAVRALAAETSTPVEPGQISVEAAVTVEYRIVGSGEAKSAGATRQ